MPAGSPRGSREPLRWWRPPSGPRFYVPGSDKFSKRQIYGRLPAAGHPRVKSVNGVYDFVADSAIHAAPIPLRGASCIVSARCITAYYRGRRRSHSTFHPRDRLRRSPRRKTNAGRSSRLVGSSLKISSISRPRSSEN